MSLSCIIIDDELHAISELSDLIVDFRDLELKNTFMEVADAVEYLEEEGGVDLVFCDIHMPNMDGLEAAELLKPFCRFLVFVTAHREYALTAFEKNASGYLLKPISVQSFTKLVNSFLENDKAFLSSNLVEKENVFFVKGGSKNSLVKVNTADIKFIEAQLNYSMIHLNDDTNILTYILLGDFERKLKGTNLLFRVNKSNIISMNYFKEINGNRVVLISGESFSIGTSYKSSLISFVKKRSLNF